VDRVATVSSERSRAVKAATGDDRLILSVNAPDSGAAEEELAVAYSDERLKIGFNAKYLLEITMPGELRMPFFHVQFVRVIRR
jgi:DNA polymerase-3 subunit beta